MADTGPLETAYDEEVSPLMAQVIAICKRAGIPMYASFYLGDDLACTTQIFPKRADMAPDDLGEFDNWREEYGGEHIRIAREPLMLTVRDGNGNVTAMEAIL